MRTRFQRGHGKAIWMIEAVAWVSARACAAFHAADAQRQDSSIIGIMASLVHLSYMQRVVLLISTYSILTPMLVMVAVQGRSETAPGKGYVGYTVTGSLSLPLIVHLKFDHMMAC